MDTGTLTPRSADVIRDARFAGNFGQPDGFGSVLKVLLRRSGGVCLTLNYRPDTPASEEHTWSVELNSEQRKALVTLLDGYEPVLWEPINYGRTAARVSSSQVERAERILHLTLPEISGPDNALDNLCYVDPNNAATRLHSIAAALYVLREAQRLPTEVRPTE